MKVQLYFRLHGTQVFTKAAPSQGTWSVKEQASLVGLAAEHQCSHPYEGQMAAYRPDAEDGPSHVRMTQALHQIMLPGEEPFLNVTGEQVLSVNLQMFTY